MRRLFSRFKFLVLSVMFFLIVLPVFAQENIISSVTISKAKNSINSYELNIDSTDVSNYKKSIEDDTTIYFDLRNSVLADDSATYYDDVNNVDSVVVKQITNNKVRIYLQGKNVKNTEIVFLNSPIENTKKTSKRVTINRPMSEYAPVNSNSLEDMENIQDWDDNSFNLSHLLSSLKNGTLGIVIAFLIVFGMIIALVKFLSKKIAQDTEPLIGLKSNKYDDFEDEITQKIKENRQNMQTNNLQDITKRAQTLQNAQNELSRAHQKYQEYLQSKYKDTNKKQYTSDSIKKGIALNQYQKSTQNPYQNQEVIRMNQIEANQTRLNNVNNSFQILNRTALSRLQTKTNIQNLQNTQRNTSPYIKRASIKEEQKTYTKPNNLKFLESVTKIYEQSGRADLADELKNTITKAKKV